MDLIKKTLYTGIGMVLKTREEVEDLAREWTQKQQMSEDEGRRFMDDLMRKYDTSSSDLEEKIEKMVRRALNKVNIATREDLDELRKEVSEIRAARSGDAPRTD